MRTIGLPSMTYEEVRAIVLAFAALSLVGGFVGAAIYGLFDRALGSALDYFDRALVARAARDSGGMGGTPMDGLTRPAYPPAWARESLGRLPDHDPLAPLTPCPVGRVVKRSDDPRPLTSEQARPASCLQDKRPAGAPVLPSGAGELPDPVPLVPPVSPASQGA